MRTAGPPKPGVAVGTGTGTGPPVSRAVTNSPVSIRRTENSVPPDTVAFGSAYRLTSQHAGELSNFLDMSDDLLTEPLEIRDGELTIRPGSGLGVDVDPDKLARNRQDS